MSFPDEQDLRLSYLDIRSLTATVLLESMPNTTYKTLRILGDYIQSHVLSLVQQRARVIQHDRKSSSRPQMPCATCLSTHLGRSRATEQPRSSHGEGTHTLLFGQSISALQNRLDALLLVLKACKAKFLHGSVVGSPSPRRRDESAGCFGTKVR